jgi:hypothetical protein
MGQAILSAGLEPEYVEVNHETPLSSLLYAYARMGIPVVLLVYLLDQKSGFHAMTVVGYAFPSDETPIIERKASHEPKARINYKARSIDRFYVHDDNIGPFAYLLIEETAAELKDAQQYDEETAEYFEAAPYTLEASWYNEDDERCTLKCAPMFAVIPIDPLIRLTFLGFHKWLVRCVELFEAYSADVELSLDDCLWDVRLQPAKELKGELRARGVPATNAILIKPYPLYIWRATVCKGGSELLDIFADATEVDTAFSFLDILYYDEKLGERIRTVLSVSEIRDEWASLVSRQLVEFLATKGS